MRVSWRGWKWEPCQRRPKTFCLLITWPEILDPTRQDEYLDAYLKEHQPMGPTEHAIVRELARHAAALDLWSAAGDAVERQGARELPDLALGAGHDDSTFSDAVLAGTMSQEIVHRCEKQMRCRSRAFYRALGKLEELQARRRKRESGDLVIPPNSFTTEVACENYLVDRFKSGKCRCPRCGAAEGHRSVMTERNRISRVTVKD